MNEIRQPSEDGTVTISRAAGTMTFPAQFMLVAAMNPGAAEGSDAIRARVVAARALQRERFARSKSKRKTPCNARMTPKEIREHCALDESAASLLQAALDDLKLSARAYDRILKVARTIADLDGNEKVDEAAIAEAVQFRSLDRQVWG
ncbi:MAG TPA: ATP-binding protein [Candidatus Methylacidiphilales bacterium]